MSEGALPFRFTDEKTLKFVEEYRRAECLWNRTRARKEEREQAYDRLRRAMDNERTVGEEPLTLKGVKVKIKNLRTYYHQELKRMKSDLGYTPRSICFKPLHSFLAKYLHQSKFKTVGDSAGDVSEDDATHIPLSTIKRCKIKLTRLKTIKLLPLKDEGDCIEVVEPQVEKIKSEPSAEQQLLVKVGSSPHAEAPPLRLLTPPTSAPLPLPPPLNYRAEQLPHITEITTLHQPLKNINNSSTIERNPMQPLQNEDEFHFFGLSVAAQLRSMPLSNAMLMQANIQNLLSTERRKINGNIGT
ncbi:uncharacterized protein LOC115619953 [Scaptodrosophila lebanonensis]|uniref:Uncharacterized protein LOC115619953 n=1 Tax=Drosophila lebanonensis TaxID=7225 RepID=A0A6J2T1R1_DROLE|nr:uncharacterized protein LOC115619953 [Scaptodrosophila lebanonensis]